MWPPGASCSRFRRSTELTSTPGRFLHRQHNKGSGDKDCDNTIAMHLFKASTTYLNRIVQRGLQLNKPLHGGRGTSQERHKLQLRQSSPRALLTTTLQPLLLKPHCTTPVATAKQRQHKPNVPPHSPESLADAVVCSVHHQGSLAQGVAAVAHLTLAPAVSQFFPIQLVYILLIIFPEYLLQLEFQLLLKWKRIGLNIGFLFERFCLQKRKNFELVHTLEYLQITLAPAVSQQHKPAAPGQAGTSAAAAWPSTFMASVGLKHGFTNDTSCSRCSTLRLRLNPSLNYVQFTCAAPCCPWPCLCQRLLPASSAGPAPCWSC